MTFSSVSGGKAVIPMNIELVISPWSAFIHVAFQQKSSFIRSVSRLSVPLKPLTDLTTIFFEHWPNECLGQMRVQTANFCMTVIDI